MDQPELESRLKVVAEARTWLGTKYVLGARLKGVGCDCATLILETFIACGLKQREQLPLYSLDWFNHTDEERYTKGLAQFSELRGAERNANALGPQTDVDDVRPGNIILGRTTGSRVFNHGAIISNWPMVIHCARYGVQEVNTRSDDMWRCQRIMIFDPWSTNYGHRR